MAMMEGLSPEDDLGSWNRSSRGRHAFCNAYCARIFEGWPDSIGASGVSLYPRWAIMGACVYP